MTFFGRFSTYRQWLDKESMILMTETSKNQASDEDEYRTFMRLPDR